MKTLREEITVAVHTAGGILTPEVAHAYRTTYRQVLDEAQSECPPPEPRHTGKRGLQKRPKARNLLERLIHYQEDVLRFMENLIVPFTNNQGENDLTHDQSAAEDLRLLSLPGRRPDVLPHSRLSFNLS